mmetsp:Transcript_18790/g.34262  ORF Transcript_18790/g.34262 Transcript_18790/m.34262 type:complete len:328 (+) Transcript_18790:21-1004(+)
MHLLSSLPKVAGFLSARGVMSAVMSTEMHTPGPTTGTSDALFAAIERMQQKYRGEGKEAAKDSWGKFLDAGTGTHSLKWVRELPLDSWTAVTADAGMQRTVESEVASPGPGEAQGTIVLGNWDDQALLQGQTYEVVLADYLIGAMDGFSPFKQDLIFDRLKQHLDPETGVLYILSLEPIPYAAETEAEEVVLDVTRMRDACILMAGDRCYREFPQTWVERQLKSHGFKVLEAQRLPILYSEASIRRQINVGRTKLPRIKDRKLAAAMKISLDDLDRRMVAAVARQAPSKRIKHGFDYIIAAEIDPAFKPDPTATAQHLSTTAAEGEL